MLRRVDSRVPAVMFGGDPCDHLARAHKAVETGRDLVKAVIGAETMELIEVEAIGP